jgi:hypothetical protein
LKRSADLILIETDYGSQLDHPSGYQRTITLKDYMMLWAEGLPMRSSLTLRAAINVTGERNKHLGPRYEFAKIALSVQPASTFEVVDSVPEDEELRREGYLDWAVFGLLDVLMLSEPFPLHKLRIVFESAEYHPVDSSPIAFLHAGRDAGRKIIDSLKNPECQG